jgi:hypothetical protein
MPLATAGEARHAAGNMPQIIAFDNEEFLGDHAHIFGNRRDLGQWGNSISSLNILSGTWEFFDNENFKGTSLGTLGRGCMLMSLTGIPKITASRPYGSPAQRAHRSARGALV